MDSQIVSLDAEKKKLEKEIDGIKNKNDVLENKNLEYQAKIVETKDDKEIKKYEVITWKKFKY